MTSDGWTSRAVQNYVTLTMHYLKTDFSNVHISLGCMPLLKSHTGENIEEFLSNTLVKWEVQEKLSTKEIH